MDCIRSYGCKTLQSQLNKYMSVMKQQRRTWVGFTLGLDWIGSDMSKVPLLYTDQTIITNLGFLTDSGEKICIRVKDATPPPL